MSDKWLAEDKFSHIAGSFFATYLFTWVFGGLPQGAIAALIAGFLVEVYQKYMTIDNFSWKDIAADVVGIAIAVVSIARG